MVKYSFIVPVYNCEAYLEACVCSLLAQNGAHSFEILLIDDGGTDGSGALADALAERYPQVRAFHKKNGGASSARNYGVRVATGEYLLFVDGDDTLEPTVLEEVEQCLSQNPTALVTYGMSFDYYRAGRLERQESLSCAHRGVCSVAELLERFAEYFDDNAFSSACNKVFLRRIFQEQALLFSEEMTLYEDLELVLRYLLHVRAAAFIDKPLYRYRNDLDKPHLNTRLYDLDKVRDNLVRVMRTAVVLQQAQPDAAAVVALPDRAAALYLQLLVHHLAAKKHTRQELPALLTNYCAEPLFRSLLREETPLGERERTLLAAVDEGRFAEIYADVRKRRRISKLKRAVKKLLRRFRA